MHSDVVTVQEVYLLVVVEPISKEGMVPLMVQARTQVLWSLKMIYSLNKIIILINSWYNVLINAFLNDKNHFFLPAVKKKLIINSALL